LKGSAFVFETPQQRAAILKQWTRFETRTGAGLELLALKRSYGERQQGSLADLARIIYELIRSGQDNLKDLNLTRIKTLERYFRKRKEEVERLRQEAEADLLKRIDVRNLDPTTLLTACIVTAADLVEDERLVLKTEPAPKGPAVPLDSPFDCGCL